MSAPQSSKLRVKSPTHWDGGPNKHWDVGPTKPGGAGLSVHLGSGSSSTKSKASSTAAASRRASLLQAHPFWRLVLTLRTAWVAYLGYLQTNPVLTKSLTAACISIISDLLAQFLSGGVAEEKGFLQAVNWTSVRNQALIGFFMRGLPVHYWYTALTNMFRSCDGSQRRVSKQSLSPRTPAMDQAERGGAERGEIDKTEKPHKSPFWVTACKVLVDQTTYGPFSNWLYFFVIGAFEGRSLAVTQAKIAREFVPIMMANWKVWPLVTLLNFMFVPPPLQVLFGNVISIFWTTYVVMVTR